MRLHQTRSSALFARKAIVVGHAWISHEYSVDMHASTRNSSLTPRRFFLDTTWAVSGLQEGERRRALERTLVYTRT